MNVPKRHVFGDKQRIQQICMNLLSNAVKFTQDGKITVSTWFKDPRVKNRSSTSVDANAMDPDKMGKLYVKVSDTGVGIPKADLCRLFRDFQTL